MTPPPDPTARAKALIHGRTTTEWPTWERWAMDAMLALRDLLVAHAQQAEKLADIKRLATELREALALAKLSAEADKDRITQQAEEIARLKG